MDGKELQIDGAAMAVVVADMRDRGADGRLDNPILIQLAGQCLFGGFASLDLAAGELPP